MLSAEVTVLVWFFNSVSIVLVVGEEVVLLVDGDQQESLEVDRCLT